MISNPLQAFIPRREKTILNVILVLYKFTYAVEE